MSGRIAYAWTAGGKWYASPVSAGDPKGHRPRNEYETRDALEAEVRQRRMDIVWEWDGIDGNAPR